MPAPTQGILEENMIFTIQTVDGNGEPVDADSLPTWSVYEDETGTSISSGSMTLFDAANTDGFYSETLNLTTANGYERFKTYTIRVEATISTVVIPMIFSFMAVGAADTFAATSGALTTLTNAQTYMGVASGTDDDLITALIARATSAIEGFCGRTLVNTSFREFYDGSGTGSGNFDDNDFDFRGGGHNLIVRQYPITAIEYIAFGTNQPMNIKNSSADAYNAYVSVDDTNMKLVVQGGANAGTTTLTLASFTVGTLSAQISATGSGWESSVADSTKSLWDATELLPVQASEALDSFAVVRLPDEPEADFKLYENEGTIRFPGGIPKGYKNIIIRYTAGFETTPAELEQICIDLVAYYYFPRKRDPSVRSEKLADHTITVSSAGSKKAIPDGIKTRLINWTTLRF